MLHSLVCKLQSNIQLPTILNSPDADDGAKGFAQTLNAYALMRVLNLTDENGARINYDGGYFCKRLQQKMKFLLKIERLLNDGLDELEEAEEAGTSLLLYQVAFLALIRLQLLNTLIEASWLAFLYFRINGVRLKEALTSVDAWMNGGDPDAGVYHVFSSGANDGDNQMYEDPNAPTLKLMVHPSFLTDADEGDSRVTNNVLVRSDTMYL